MGIASSIKDEILEIIKRNLKSTPHRPLILFLEGGHYDPRGGATEHSMNTLNLSIEITKNCIKLFDRNVRIVLGILVDDLGLECAGDVCSIPESTLKLGEGHRKDLPAELEDILANTKFVKRDRVVISSERNAKNRGIAALKKIIDTRTPANLKLVDNVFLYLDGIAEVPISTVNGDFWSAKCPLIMGQHYFDSFVKNEKRFDKSRPQMLVDFSDIYDRNKVTNGAKVCLNLLKNGRSSLRQIINVCFKDDNCTKYSLDIADNIIQ